MGLLDPKPVSTTAIDGVVRDKINLAGSATKVALDATYAAKSVETSKLDVTTAAATYATAGVPLYAGTRTKRFSPDNSIYNGYSLKTRKARAKLSAALNGTGRAKILYLGHSEVAGQGGYTGTGDTSIRLRQVLANLGYPVGTGWVYAHNKNGQPQPTKDSRWSNTGSFVYDATSLFGSYNTATQSSVFTADVAGDTVDIATYGNGQSIAYNINGTTGTLTTNASSAVQVATVAVTVPVGGTITLTATTAASMYILGVNVRKASTVEVTNAGLSGAAAADWLPTANADAFYNIYKSATLTALPDVVVIELDANEALNGVTTATFKTNMTTLINALKALTTTPEIFLVHACSMVPGGGGYAAVTQATWDSFGSALYDLADTFDVPLLDMTHRTGLTFAEANANGVMFDQVHPNNLYYADKARGIAQMIGL